MALDPGAVAVFAPSSSRRLGAAVCHIVELPVGELEERDFEDGEHKARPVDVVRGKDVYVIASLHGDGALRPDEKLCRLLFLLGALRDASCARLTAVVPYLCYARQERRSQPHDPVATRYVAAMMEAMGTDRVLTLDVHDRAAYDNAFRIRAEHLEARPLFVAHLAPRLGDEEVAVVSPDAGGVKNAERVREALERALRRTVSSAFLSKLRGPTGLRGGGFAGDVEGRLAIIVDDMVASGATLARAAHACREHGARGVIGAVTHGLFAGDAGHILAGPELDHVVTTNTVEPWRLAPELLRDKVTVLDVAPLLAEAIERLHRGLPLGELARD